MSTNMLSQGISILYDMETNNYLMTRSIQKLNGEIYKLGEKRGFRLPEKRQPNVSIIVILITITLISAIVGGLIGLIQGFATGNGFFDRLGQALSGLVALVVYCGIGGAAVGLISGITAKIIAYARAKKEYEEDYEEYQKKLENDALRVKRELKQRDYLMSERDSLYFKREESQKLLNQFYIKMNIDRNYRNIVPIGYMNEFMRLGIATKLEGADGLYYLVMRELKADQLQYTLEEISGKLDIIIDKQRDIYRELVKTNQRCDDLVRIAIESSKKAARSLNEIEKNSRVSAYNSERIAQEMAYQNFMLTYRAM